MSKQDLILIGGGGHCRACIDVIEVEDKYHIVGIVDIESKLHEKILGYEILFTDKDLPKLTTRYKNFLITIGNIKDFSKRISKYKYLKQLGAHFPVIISPSAYIAKKVAVGEGTVVMHNVVVNSNAEIGKNCIINTISLVEHDSTIGDHCHISTGSIVNGTCKISSKVFLGSQSVIANDISICEDVIVGAGAVVIKHIYQSGIYVGNPAFRRS